MTAQPATIRVGIIGTGVMGADHASLLDSSVSGAVVSAVADADAERAAGVAKGLAAARVVLDPLELIAADDVDAVLVASADQTHEAFVLACLRAGKPVLCEKPLAPTEAAARRMLDAERALGAGTVNVGFMRRFDPGYVELKEIIDGGVIGVPLVVHCVHRNASSQHGATAADVVTGSVIHEIDAARWLLGEEIVAVRSHAPHRRGQAESAVGPVLVTLEAASGTVVAIEAFVNATYGYDVRCEVVGDRGTVALDPVGPTATMLGGQRRQPIAADWRPRFSEAYRLELQNWVTALRSGTLSSAASAWDGYVATLVAERAVESLATGQRVAVITPPS
jgi:myo-inositol 2-dehydrogenase / D-chiro-inositol 1-dehydrogenase